MASEVSEVTTQHDQHSIRREQRLEPQTVRQRRLHVALVSHLESQERVRLANPSPPPRPPPARTGIRRSAFENDGQPVERLGDVFPRWPLLLRDLLQHLRHGG